MWNLFMVKGLTPQQKRHQMMKDESDFRNQANQRLQSLEIGMAAMNSNIAELFGKLRSLDVSLGIKLDSHIKEQRQQRDAHISQVEKENMKMANNANQAVSLFNHAVKTYLSKEQHDKDISSYAAGLAQVAKELKEFKDSVTSLSQHHTADMERRLQAFKDEVNNRPSDIPKLKKELEQKIDLVALDGTNSVIRTQNFEKQLFIIEKKIEQLFLLIKNLEIRQA